MKKNFSLILGICLMFASCSEKEDLKIEKAFQDLSARYKTLKSSADSSLLSHYTLIFTSNFHLDKMIYRVYRDFHAKERTSILTLQYQDKIEAIPIFPFNDTCYWNYENEAHKCDPTLTFAIEYNRMISRLGLTDSVHKAYYPYAFIENNLLHLKSLAIQDTSIFLQDYPYQDSIVKVRNRKNLNNVIKLIHPEEYLFESFASTDCNNEYVLWGTTEKGNDKKIVFKFKSFHFKRMSFSSFSADF